MRYLFKSYSWSSYSEIMLSGEYFIAVSLAFLKDLENLLKKVVRALCSAEISLRKQCPKSHGESSVGPSIRNGISRRLEDIAVLVQSKLAFLTFIDLHLHGQTVSDYHPLCMYFNLNGIFELTMYYNFWIHYFVTFFTQKLVLVSMHPKNNKNMIFDK